MTLLIWLAMFAFLAFPSVLAVLACVGSTRADRAAERDYERDAMRKEAAR